MFTLKEILGAIGIIFVCLLCIGGIFVVLALVMYPSLVLECKHFGLIMNIPWKMDFWSGCYLYYKDMWIPHEQLYMLLGK